MLRLNKIPTIPSWLAKMDLNTSHVKVKLSQGSKNAGKLYNLNTSHVKVKLLKNSHSLL